MRIDQQDRDRAASMQCSVCGDADWFAVKPGTMRITTGDDDKILLMHPIPEVASLAWCTKCWPWKGIRSGRGRKSPRRRKTE